MLRATLSVTTACYAQRVFYCYIYVLCKTTCLAILKCIKENIAVPFHGNPNIIMTLLYQRPILDQRTDNLNDNISPQFT